MDEKKTNKSAHSEREEKILDFWRENQIFEKTLEKNKNKGKKFVFFEGPPTANGKPGIHHLEARAFKDAIPRYKTMCGYYVRRKGGWDTHGLPVELQVEKELGLKSKKEIEKYGIATFNEKCKESVWKYVHEWEAFTNRIGYWVDLKDPYITYKPKYIESIWNIIKQVDKQELLYKDYKVVPWCPRCGTALSSHELAQGYEDVKDLSVYVKFKVKNPEKIGLKGDMFLLAWTTTPWTLPGNVGLAVGEKVEYVSISSKVDSNNEEIIILAKERLENLRNKAEFEDVAGKSWKGKDLIGLEYEPLYPFIVDNISGAEKEKLQNAYKVYPADFVTTTDGTGIVHTAVMYGQEDFDLGTKVGLPKYHIVNEDGTFKKEAGAFAGAFVKDPNTDVSIIKDLAGRNLLFAKEKYEHSYPFCWRCKTPLIYFARDSWYIKMSVLRDKLVANNQKINWEPEHIKEGRFGEWLSEIKDWAISRERYWGTPLPIWVCNNEKCGKKKVVGSKVELENKSSNTYFIMRHGQSENNVKEILNSDVKNVFHLTEKGKNDVQKTAETIKEKFDLIISSPLQRTKETAEIVAKVNGYKVSDIILDNRLLEVGFGELEGASEDSYSKLFSNKRDFFYTTTRGVETRQSIKKRISELLNETETKYKGKKILFVSHDASLWMMASVAQGCDVEETMTVKPRDEVFMKNAEFKSLDYKIIPRNEYGELDLHRPFIDDIVFDCSCGHKMQRVKEVMDVWFDSGAMPFAQDHYPFENTEYIEKGAYPADYISEAIDQTRGWFYTLHAIGVLMGRPQVYKNVICLGHILDKDGKKMSKSVGNVIDPWLMIEKYGVDAVRLWMYSVNQPGESKNFDERTVDEIQKRVFNLLDNVLSFYELYRDKSLESNSRPKSNNVLDQWIIALQDELVMEMTKNLESYKLLEPVRLLREFINELSTWYLRRSREGIKDGDNNAKQTLYYVLRRTAVLMAPFAPFMAEDLYQKLRLTSDPMSVHLEGWVQVREGSVFSRFTHLFENAYYAFSTHSATRKAKPSRIIESMQETRRLVTLALEERNRVGVKVRQPLSKLEIKNSKLGGEYLEIIKDEINVKDISADPRLESDVRLNTILTPELEEEGRVRDAIRAIQEWRKEQGLQPGQVVKYEVVENREFFLKHRVQIERATQVEILSTKL